MSSSFSTNFRCFAGFLVVLWGRIMYANGCFTSIISFGDSIADTGNIKHLGSITGQAFPSLFPPYGQTFFNKPTGRCSDGRLIIDFLAESLGLPFVPPYMYDQGRDNVAKLDQSVNYAVAGATAVSSQLLAEEGIQNPVTNASLKVQLQWFKHSLLSVCGNASDCKDVIGRSLFLMGEIGGNDYNFPIRDGKPIEEIKAFVPSVINSIASTLDELIEMGARTLVVPGNFPIGCSSAHLTERGSKNEEYDPATGCLVQLNQFVEYHNELLQTKLNQIRELHPYANIIYADYYNAAMQIYQFPYTFGFTNGALKACCGAGGPFNYNSTTTCGHEYATVCDEPDTYVNWDGVHLTEATYKVIFKSLFQGPYTTPAFSSLCYTLSQVGVYSESI